MKTKNLVRPGDLAQEGTFWKLVPEDVIGRPTGFTSADFGFIMWRVKKDKMGVATGVTWTESEWGPRTLQLREYLLRAFCVFFVDDRPFHSGSLCWHANVQPKAVFSFAMTVMDKIYKWTAEEKCVGSKFAACM